MIKTDVVVIGAGPVGLFAVHQLGLIGLKAEVVDNLDKVGGQCIELYPDKPIYDIPGLPECSGESLTKNLLEQIKPFKTNFHLSQRVEEISKEQNNWKVVTTKKNIFLAPNIIIAAGVGSFEPRKFPIKETEKFENKSVFYSVKDKNFFKNKKICIFGGGDSALDWAIELSKFSDVTLVHRRSEFRGAEHSSKIVKKLEKEKKIKVKTSFQINSMEGKDKLTAITIKDDNDKIEKIEVDFLLGFLDPKTSVLGILGCHFGTLGVHFGDPGLHVGVFWEALTPLGAQLGHFGGIYQKLTSFRRRILVHVGLIFGAKVATLCFL